MSGYTVIALIYVCFVKVEAGVLSDTHHINSQMLSDIAKGKLAKLGICPNCVYTYHTNEKPNTTVSGGHSNINSLTEGFTRMEDIRLRIELLKSELLAKFDLTERPEINFSENHRIPALLDRVLRSLSPQQPQQNHPPPHSEATTVLMANKSTCLHRKTSILSLKYYSQSNTIYLLP